MSFLHILLLAFIGAGLAQDEQLPDQYKRVHQKALAHLVQGKLARASELLEQELVRMPGDAETRFLCALVEARRGDAAASVARLREAVQRGLPVERVLVGAHRGLDAVEHSDEFRAFAAELRAEAGHPLILGPMLGCLTHASVDVWVRSEGAREVVVEAHPKSGGTAVRSAPEQSERISDFAVRCRLEGLEPGTEYRYVVLVDGRPTASLSTQHFTTPKAEGSQTLRIAFGGGSGYVPPHERVWRTIRERSPDLLLLLGDNVYIDHPEMPEMQHYCYYRRQARPEFRLLVAGTPVYSIWDDHDFGVDDCAHGPSADEPAWKRPVWRVFRDNWVNPAYGDGEAAPGCWYEFRRGDVHFFLLDGRMYRERQEGARSSGDPAAPPSMLGPRQKAWLKEAVVASDSPFKVLCSPVPWTFFAKGDSKDTWNGFRAERDEIFGLLTARSVSGVLLVSADRHRSDLWKIERNGAYPLYEFNSSRLTNQHVHPTMQKAEFSYNAKQSFGLVDFDLLHEQSATYRIISIDGEVVYSFQVELTSLR